MQRLYIHFQHVVESSVEESSTQYLHITETEDLQGTEAAVAALQDLRYNTENGKYGIMQIDRE